MTENYIDTVVIGAGVVGLAVARKFALSKKDVLVVEEQSTFGTITSTRNSGVIHAGIYYDKDSLKAKLCPIGNRLIYEYCERHKIPYINTGKFVVSTNVDETQELQRIYDQSGESEVEGVKFVSKDYVQKKESLISCVEALHVPSTGIVDQSALMRSYLGEIENNGGSIAFNSKFLRSAIVNGCYVSKILSDGEEIEIKSNTLINAAGLWSDKVSLMLGINKLKIHYCKGEYYKTNKYRNINCLIYPLPSEISLGTHVAIQLNGDVLFGPNAYYVNDINYSIDDSNKNDFLNNINKYMDIGSEDIWPDFCGIRPKLQAEGKPFEDFYIKNEADQGITNFINLLGIDSPGLTSSLAIAEFVEDIII